MNRYRPYRDIRTVTLSTVGAYNSMGTNYLSGSVQSVYVAINKAAGAAGKVVITTSSTQRVILTILDPSTLGAFYRPKIIDHGTTGQALSSRSPLWLCDNRLKIKVSSSSGLAGSAVTVHTVIG